MNHALPRSAPSGVGALAPARPLPPQPASKLPTVVASPYSWPFLFVLGYLLVDFARPHDWVPVLGYMRPGLIVLGGGMICLFRFGSVPKDPLIRNVLMFLGLMVLAIPMAYNPRVAFNSTRDMTLFVFGALLPLVTFVDSYERLLILVRFWVCIHVPLALYSILHGGVGIGSFLVDENDFALAMNMALPYGFALVQIAPKTTGRLFYLAITLILMLGSTATMSRGGFLGLVCVFGMLWLRSPRKVLSLVVVTLLGVVLAAAAPAKYWAEVESIGTSTQEGDTGDQRLYLWGIAWQMFKDNPILGVGPSNYQYNNINYEDEDRKAKGTHVWGQVAHSLYFTLLPEFGIVGCVLFAVLVIRGWRLRRRGARRCRDALADKRLPLEMATRVRNLRQIVAALDAGLVTFLVTGAFISVLYYPHFWLLTAYTVVTVKIIDGLLPAASPAPAAVTRAPAPLGRHALPAIQRPR